MTPLLRVFFAKATASDAKRCFKPLRDKQRGGCCEASSEEDEDGKRKWARNAERDSHGFFGRMGLSLPIQLCTKAFSIDGNVIDLHYVRTTDWLAFLLHKCPCVLAGGRERFETQLAAFWDMYRWAHPGHCVFKMGDERLHRTIPLVVFADEGKGPKRGNYMVTTIESPIGIYEQEVVSCECCRVVQEHADHIPDSYGQATAATLPSEVASRASTNFKGHSYLTRHILFGLTDVVYKQYPSIYQDMLGLVAEEFRALFRTGLQVLGTCFYAAVIGHKGDLKHTAEKAARLTRSYAHLGRVNHLHICSLCLAGDRQYPWDELSERPAWIDSLYHSRPWVETPQLCNTDFDDAAPELFFRLDLFHLIKAGLGRDLAGAIVVLCRLSFFDGMPGESRTLAGRLRRAHSAFKLWCISNHKSPALRYFSPVFFNVKKLADFPWANSKASDTILLLDFLRWYCDLQRQTMDVLPAHLQTHRRLLKLISLTSDHGLAIFRLCNSHGLWLDRTCAQALWVHMTAFLSGYQALASLCVRMKMSAFGLKPKWHGTQHVAYDLEVALRTAAPKILNPICWACDQNEDHIGKICTLALKVSTRTINRRVIQRHFLKTSALLRRHLKARRKSGLPL